MIRVLIVDDSSFMRKSLTYLLESDRSIEVAGTASDGVEAIQKVKELRPDVVLLDIEMPRMDGLMALMYIMNECPTPVLMLSALNKRNPTIVIKSLEYGAVDFIAKPSGVISYDIDKISNEILTKVKMAADIDVYKLKLSLPEESFQKERAKSVNPKEMVVIGGSTGGPRAIVSLLSGLPHNIPTAILVVQHLRPEFVPSLVDRLRWACPLEISIAQEGDVINSGQVSIAPGYHTTIVREGNIRRIHLATEAPHNFITPSINDAMESVAETYGKGGLGVLLTGMGDDGAHGMKAIKDAGGSTIAEDQSTCIVFGMPRAAIEMGCVDVVVPLPRIAQTILRMI